MVLDVFQGALGGAAAGALGGAATAAGTHLGEAEATADEIKKENESSETGESSSAATN